MLVTGLLCAFLSAAAWADLTIQGTHSPGISGGVEHQVIYLGENQMRIDQLAPETQENAGNDGVTSSMLIRFSGSPPGLLFLDHQSRRVQMLSSLRGIGAAETGAIGSDRSAHPVRVEKRDETREILGKTAYRYDFSFAGDVDPLALLGQQLPEGMSIAIRIQLQVNGTSWVVPGMEGASELADFFKQLNGRQLTIGMLGPTPSQTTHEVSMLSPGLSSAITDVLMQLTRAGFPLLTETSSQLTVEQTGAMSAYFQGVLDAMGIGGQKSTRSVITSVQAGKLPPERFYDRALPRGYSLNTP